MHWLLRLAISIAGTVGVLLAGAIGLLIISVMMTGSDLRNPAEMAVYVVLVTLDGLLVLAGTIAIWVSAWRR